MLLGCTMLTCCHWLNTFFVFFYPFNSHFQTTTWSALSSVDLCREFQIIVHQFHHNVSLLVYSQGQKATADRLQTSWWTQCNTFCCSIRKANKYFLNSTHHWLTASNRNQRLVSWVPTKPKLLTSSGSFSPVIIPPVGTGPSTSIYFSAQESQTITSSRPLDSFITLYSIFVGNLVSQAKPWVSEESIQYFSAFFSLD